MIENKKLQELLKEVEDICKYERMPYLITVGGNLKEVGEGLNMIPSLYYTGGSLVEVFPLLIGLITQVCDDYDFEVRDFIKVLKKMTRGRNRLFVRDMGGEDE